MAYRFFGTKGCYFMVHNEGGSAYYELSPSLGGEGFFITNAVITGEDNTVNTICFNDIRVASVTGRAFGRMGIEGIALIGPVTSPASREIVVQNYYNSNRFSSRGKPITLSTTGGGTHKFLLTSYSLNGVDQNFNILRFSLGGTNLD